MSEEIYLDKIRLGATIVDKELILIGAYNSLLKDLRERSDILDFLNEYEKFNVVWQNLAELYDFLKNDYLSKINKEERERIKEIMQHYTDNLPLTLGQLKEAKEIILRIMSLSKFHDIVRKGEMRGLPTVKDRYKLKEN